MKKKLRTLLSLLLVFSLVFVQGSITVNAGVIYGAVDDYYADVFNEEYQVYENLMWKYDHINNELIVGGKGAMPDFTVGNRPWDEYWDKALKVTIVGDLTTVGKYAFANFYSLEVLRFMADITTIQAYAFSDCPELYTIHMPPSVKTIASYAFMNSTNVWAIHYEGTSTEAASINLTTNTFLKNKFYCNHYRGVNLVVIENVKTEYQTGEAFYADVYACSDNGKLSSRISNYQVKNFDTTTPGTQTVLVGYNGYYKEFEVNVYGEAIEPEIVFENVQTEYAIGEAFYAEVYEYCGEVVNKIPLADCIIDGFDNSTEGYQTVSITYNDYTEFFKVYVYSIEAEYNFEWSFDEGSRELYIYGDGEMPDFMENTAPWSDFAYEIRTVIIDGQFMNISPGAFMGCYELDTVIIRSEAELIIQHEAFADCHNLSMIYIPLSVRHIEYDAFRHDDNIIGVYYQGSEEDWNYINCDDRYLLSARDIFFNCDDVEIHESVVIENVKTEYQFGEYFYAEVYVTAADGNRFMVEDYEVIGYDRHNSGWQTVTVKYGDYSEDFEVYVMEMTDVRNEYTLVVENPVTEYEYGDEFYAEVYIHNNFGDSMQIEDYEVIGFDSYTQGRQTVTIKFEHLEQKIEVYVNGVSDDTNIESVEIAYAKRSYYPGDEFYAELLVTYVDGTDEIVTDFEVEGFDSYNPCAQKVLIRYGEYELYTTVRVYPASEAPQISQLTFADLNTEYYIGDELQVEIIGVKDDGSYITISLAECIIDGFDNTTPGEQVVTVTYGGLSVEFGVTVYEKDEPDVPAVPDVPEIPEVVDFKYIKTEYEFGEEFYAEVYVIDANGEQLKADYYVEGFDSYIPGWQTVTVIYKDQFYTCDVYVNEQQPQIVDVDFEIERNFEYGEEFSATAVVYYDDGTVKRVKDCEVEGYDPYAPGDHAVKVIYGEYSITVIVTVGYEQPQVTVNNVKTEYEYGEDFYAEVQVSCKGETTDVYDYKVIGFDSYSPGVQKVTISYLNYRNVFTVVVNEPEYVEPEIRPVVSVSSERCRAGNTVDVVISLSENTGFANLGLEISYDTAMTLVAVTANSNVGATFTKAQSLDVYPYNIGWDSVSNNDYNGELVTLTFEIPEDMCAGEYSVDVDFYKGRNGDYKDGVSVNYDENENPLFLEYNSGCITVFDYIPGDINGDGTVTNKDGTALLRYLAGWELENIIEEALDVDGDGAITNKDGTRLLRYLAGWDVEIF